MEERRKDFQNIEKVHNLKVKDIMTSQPVTVSEDATIEQCALIMAKNKIGSLIIEDDAISGLITEQDIVRNVVSKGLNPKLTLAKDIMVKHLITVRPNKSLEEAVKLMAKHEIRHLPVISTKDLEGFLTAKDILRIEPLLFREMTSCFKILDKTENKKE